MNSAQTALMLQEETIRRNERDIKYLNDKIGELERQLSAVDGERRNLDEKICQMKKSGDQLEAEKKNVSENLDSMENKATKLELTKRSLEGDLQRLSMQLNERDSEYEVSRLLQFRYEGKCLWEDTI